MQSVLLRATYRNSLAVRNWLLTVHIPDFKYVAGVLTAIVADLGDSLQVDLVIPKTRWQAYLISEDRNRIATEARNNGFIEAVVWNDAVVISDDDAPRRGNSESRDEDIESGLHHFG